MAHARRGADDWSRVLGCPSHQSVWPRLPTRPPRLRAESVTRSRSRRLGRRLCTRGYRWCHPDVADEAHLREAFPGLESRVGDAMTAAWCRKWFQVESSCSLALSSIRPSDLSLRAAAAACSSTCSQIRCFAYTRSLTRRRRDARRVSRAWPSCAATVVSAPCDEHAVVDALLRVSALVESCPEIQELELNPLKVLPRGARAVDVRVRIGHGRARVSTRRISY